MGTEFDDTYTRYQTERSRLRKLVRALYLKSAKRKLAGPCLDFGCGVGELLAMLPPGSKGVEYNQASVAHCRRRGLSVEWYDGVKDDWQLTALPPEWRFESLVISHVLEHLQDPMYVLARLLAGGERRGVRRALVIVPGRAGYRIDATHRTFVDLEMIRAAGLERHGWRLTRSGYFPGNMRAIGDWFPHHELQVLLTRAA